MSRRKIKAGTTSMMVPIFIQDTSSNIGAGLGSLVYNSSGLAARYRREGASSWTTITLATATLGTFTSGGFITSSGVTGKYEVGIPDAALASGAKWVEIEYYGATNMLPVLLEFELDLIDYQDSVRAGLTALPNATAGSNGGLPLAAANGGVKLSDQGRIEAASGVWTSLTSDYSGINQFGFQLQPIYYADIKQAYNVSNTNDEYGVDWYRGHQLLPSGSVSDAFISVYNVADGTAVFQNSGLFYKGTNNGSMRYVSYVTLTGGILYNVLVSGTIDGSIHRWQEIVGRTKLT